VGLHVPLQGSAQQLNGRFVTIAQEIQGSDERRGKSAQPCQKGQTESAKKTRPFVTPPSKKRTRIEQTQRTSKSSDAQTGDGRGKRSRVQYRSLRSHTGKSPAPPAKGHGGEKGDTKEKCQNGVTSREEKGLPGSGKSGLGSQGEELSEKKPS